MLVIPDCIKNAIDSRDLSEHTYKMVINMMNAVIELRLINYVINFDEDGGFMFSRNENSQKLGNHPLVIEDSHSGSSFAITLRICQAVLKSLENLENYSRRLGLHCNYTYKTARCGQNR